MWFCLRGFSRASHTVTQALISAIPDPTESAGHSTPSAPRCSNLQAGVSAAVASLVIVQLPNGALEHFNWLGYIVIAIAMVSSGADVNFLHKQVPEQGISRYEGGPRCDACDGVRVQRGANV